MGRIGTSQLVNLELILLLAIVGFGFFLRMEAQSHLRTISPAQDMRAIKNLRVLVFYNSDSDIVWAHHFEGTLNQSILVETWDIKVDPFPTDPAVLKNSSLVILDAGIASYHLGSDQKAAIWSALNDGTPLFFNCYSAEVYYDKFGVMNSWNKTNYIWLDHNHPVLAPEFLYPAGTGWHSDDIYFCMNTTALPSNHKMLLQCNNSKGESPFPVVIYGKYGNGKFAVITGFINYDIPWVVSRVAYWLLPDDQPLRQYWSYLSIAFRDDDLGGGWAGGLDDQISNMTMALSWGVPMTWAFACEEPSRKIWSDPKFIAKLKELEDAGHELFLHGAGYTPDWQGYSYSEAKARIEELMENYEEVLGHPPRGWVTPQHGYTDTIVQVLKDLGFKYDSENRGKIGTILLNDKVIDVSAQYHIRLNLNAYKDYVDRVWLFGPRILCFSTHFYAGDLKEIDQWINDFKEFVSNYPHRWITLDELAHNVHGQPHVKIAQITSDANRITVKASSSIKTIETTFFLELKNSTISNAIVNGVAVHFGSKNALMIRVSRETEVIIEIGTPKEDVRVIYADAPPVDISFVKQEFAVSLLVSQGRNVTAQINIPYDNSWDVNCTEPSWGKEWNSTTRILTVWTESDGSFTITVFGIEDEFSPMANAGADQTIDEDSLVIFDGSGSYDNVGIVSYVWTFRDVAPKVLMGVNPTYIFATPYVCTVTLNVSDAAGNWDTDTVIIKVLDVTNPVADAGPDRTMPEDTSVSFVASSSSDNVGIVSYEWEFGDGTTGTGATTTHTYTEPGTYSVTLMVRDEAGNIDRDLVVVTVEKVFPWWIVRAVGVGLVVFVCVAVSWKRKDIHED